jgi:hypothetical protein
MNRLSTVSNDRLQAASHVPNALETIDNEAFQLTTIWQKFNETPIKNQ